MLGSENEYKRKFLVLIDDTAESDRAVTFAAHRVKRTGGTLVLLAVIETADFQQFLGVEEVMRAEARQEAVAHGLGRLRRHIARRRPGAAGGEDQRAALQVGEIGERCSDQLPLVRYDPGDRAPGRRQQLAPAPSSKA